MLLAALSEVQKNVAEVMVLPDLAEKRVTVKVDAYRRDFFLSEVHNIATLYGTLNKILTFVGLHVGEGTRIQNVEYAAINGLLSTLDPHSLLLAPDVYRNMKAGTRGSFGGLGIVISIRNGMLTVVSPIDDTPASRAGLRAGDRIVKIGNESTVNMTLNEAVNRLRGEPRTKVTLWIARNGWPEPKRFTITRAIIRIKSASSRMLQGNVGYLRVKHFSRGTARDVVKHLKELRKRGARSLVLDLFNNPGGLLDEAVVTADLFLDRGEIVTTVGYAGKKRESMKAKSANTVWRQPVVVLVNSGSASASEVLAGALKGNNRAVVIGHRTFGKGSVQVLFDNEDGSAFKLTIAQYLTPGDVSIQSVGIVPDIRLVPVVVKPGRVQFNQPSHSLRERDLKRHLMGRNVYRQKEAPVAEIPYLAGRKGRKSASAVRLSGNAASEAITRMATMLLAARLGNSRKRMLARIDPFVVDVREKEERRIIRALTALGVDWNIEPASEVPMLEAVVHTDRPDNLVRTGQTIRVKVTVSNLGLGPAYRVRAVTSAPGHYFDRKEFVFGRIDPGQIRTWIVPVRIPQGSLSQIHPLKITFFEEYGHQPTPVEIAIRVQGRRRPLFACQYQLIDEAKGNRDGLPQRGESVGLRVTVRNLGPGRAMETLLTVKNMSGSAVFIRKGRFAVGALAVGQERTVDFAFDIQKETSARSITLELAVSDGKLQTAVRERIVFPLARSSRPPADLEGIVEVVASEAELRGGADSGSPLLGQVLKGSTFKLLGKIHGWYRVQWSSGNQAFLAVQDAKRLPPGLLGPAAAKLKRHFQITPPLLKLRRLPLVTAAPYVTVKGVAHDDTNVKDVYVEVGQWKGVLTRQKVYYQSNRSGFDPRTLKIAARVPLKVGLNYVKVVARQNNRVETERVFICLRRPSALAKATLPGGDRTTASP
jgi:carboxyl-terminal processing protease